MGDHDHGGGDEDDHGHGDGHDHGHGGHGDDHHDHHHHDRQSLGVAVVTVSSTRSLDDDPAGDAIAAAFEGATGGDHEVVVRELVPDDHDRVQGIVDTLVGRDDVDVVVTTGGTGVTPDDVTVEAVEPLLSKDLPGFGELFRRLSFDEIGTRVVGTRAAAGVAHGVLVASLPGSEHAARLGAEEILVPEAPHLAGLAGRDEGDGGTGGEAEGGDDAGGN